MTELFVRRGRGSFTFGAATLRTRWTWRRAQIHIGERVWTVERTDRHRIGVTASAGNSPAVRLHPQQSHVPALAGLHSHHRGHRRGGAVGRLIPARGHEDDGLASRLPTRQAIRRW
jgi:hypothetical protein